MELKELPIEDILAIMATPDLEEWLNSSTWEQAFITGSNIDIKEYLKKEASRLKK